MTIARLDHMGHRDQAGAHEIIESVRGHLAFDIGANVGTTAKVLAANFHRVVACEPCQESFDVLLVESAPNVVCHLEAVASEPGEVSLTECEGSIATGQLTSGEGLAWGRATGCRTVPATTVDALIDHYGEPDFVKIDTEGAEVDILEGWKHPHRCKVLIEVHRADNEDKVRRLWGGELHKLVHAPTVNAFTRANHFWLCSPSLLGGHSNA